MFDASIIYDPETERYLIGALLDKPAAIWEIRQVVQVSDFAITACAIGFEAMCEISDAGRVADVIAVTDHLAKSGRLAAIGVTYFHEIESLGVMGYQAHEYAEIVRDYGERRRLVDVAAQIRELAEQGGEHGSDIVERAAGILANVRADLLRETHSIGEGFDQLLEDMRAVVPYTPTPWASVNEMIGGIRPGNVYTCAARSGGGKSIFGLQLSQHIAELGGRVLYVSLEMMEQDLLKRLVSMMKGIHLTALQNHELTEQGWVAVESARTAIASLPLEVYDRPGATFADIVGKARAVAQKGDLKLIVIDYFGLIASPAGSSSQSRTQDLQNYANGFVTVAKELGCAVLLLEQINRDASGRKSPRPIVSDLRGTAALEHAASAVIFLHREEKKIGGKLVMTRDIDFIIPKNRQGQPGERTLTFQGEYARIMQREYVHTALLNTDEV